MLDALVMRPGGTAIFLWPPEGPSHWRIDPGTVPAEWEFRPDVVLDGVTPDLHEWPIGADSPEAVLCISRTDPKHFRVFKYRRDIDRSMFLETGWNYGGMYAASRSLWDRLLGQHAEIRARLADPEDLSTGVAGGAIEPLQQGA